MSNTVGDPVLSQFEAVWETAGHRIASSLDGVAAALVIGADPIATASVALGIGRAQSERRRVAIGDLIGEVHPLQSLVHSDDAHGIVDSFLYGVSINKLARQVDEEGNLFVLPTGIDPTVTEDILRSERWRRLATIFRDEEALLLLAATSDTRGIDQLARMLEGVVLVGSVASPAADVRVLAEVKGATRRETARDASRREEVAAPLTGAVATDATSERAGTASPVEIGGEQHVATPMKWWYVAAIIALAALFGAAIALFARDRLLSAKTRERRELSAAGNATVSGATPSSRAPRVLPGVPPRVLPIANPTDSARAALYAVEFGVANTGADAARRLRESGRSLPAGTYSAVKSDSAGTQWFQVRAGAFTQRKSADSLLASLRESGLVGGSGRVVKAPFALLLDSAVTKDVGSALSIQYMNSNIPAYALAQTDGTARVYVGAFTTVEEASLAAAGLKSSNVDATLVYRIGRSY